MKRKLDFTCSNSIFGEELIIYSSLLYLVLLLRNKLKPLQNLQVEAYSFLAGNDNINTNSK